MPARLSVRLLTAGVILAVAGASLQSSASAAVTPVTSGSDPVPSARTVAQDALSQATALFAGTSSLRARRAGGAPATGRDATLVLRNLAVHARDLPTSAQRATAARLLSRPTSSDDPTGGSEPKYAAGSPVGSDCGPHVCVHWVEDSSVDSVHGAGVTGNDGDVATIPTQVATTLATMEHVYDVEVTGLGYLAPLPDAAANGNDETDVFLTDLGNDSLYGYCTSDQADRETARTVYGYCVLDNDYAASQYGSSHTPLQDLQVTAAHEFFHAIQFAYDWTEDDWLMEGTAAWMEDEVYDNVNDNFQYLSLSPLTYPDFSVDFTDWNYPPYGAWVFWKFLSEWAGPGSTSDPSIVRRVWFHAQGPTYSTAALQQVLLSRGSSFAKAFTVFGRWINDAPRYFSEGAAYHRSAPTGKFMTLTRTHRYSGSWGAPVDHMAHRFVRFTPGTSLIGRWRLRVNVDMADLSRGSAAQLIVHRRDGGQGIVPFRLSRGGVGSRVVAFRRSTVRFVELDLVNASIRMSCYRGTGQSCAGVALDDGLGARFNGRVIR